MRNVPYYLLVFSFIFISCSNESIDEVVIAQNEKDLEIPKNDESEEAYDATAPCDFSLNDVSENTVVTINCILDLNGETITLPSNVTLDFDGGDIKNGSIEFLNGTIDSRLLSNELAVTGDYKLKDDMFYFIPSRWGIIQGEVSNEIAAENKNIIQTSIDKASKLQANTFIINKMDAYFKVGDPTGRIVPENAAISLPANFTLKMSSETHLRVQPNNYKKHTLMSVTGGNDNVVIDGGNLHGDRDEHDYSIAGSHEWGHILQIKGTSNTIVTGVTFRDATGDGLNVSGIYHYFDERHIPSQQILITNNKFYNCRRINLSITSGNNITVENNTFVDGGIDTDKSKGAAPRCNFNIESFRRWEGEFGGTLKEYEKVTHVYVRNNIQKGRGRFLTHHSDGPVIYEGNEMESAISFQYANGVQIKNNIFNANAESAENGNAITAGVANTTAHPLVFGNEVYGNEIYGYHTGINTGGKDVKIYDNHIEARTSGIAIGYGNGEGLVNSSITNNTIKTDQYGIRARKLLKNVDISGNTVTAATNPLHISNINQNPDEASATFTLSNNILRGANQNNTYSSKLSILNNVNGVNLNRNVVTGGFSIEGSKNITAIDNEIESTSTDGFRFRETATTHSNFSENSFNLNSNFECFNFEITRNNTIEISSSNRCN
ncbi:right-handed parallel beta-helix repeat-containing protein [Aquimarina intermedia]|uniref:Right handed beta helix region n=1 Tax=Aquimarina intermedia TaxID=350814 RepID=A0A5S5CAY0_9FLAO|nr:right-handed parallel beta-helix repeat-containing protein [Aquimarina intermedia]TYP75153.1 Right handed beta helix region [Aquimarina intermedia]